MKTTIPKTIAFSIALTVILLLTKRLPDNPWSLLIVGLLINIISAPIGFYIVELIANIKRLPLFFQTRILLPEQYIRMSFAYLIRIKVNGKYLLVKNRKGNYYQLVGGAYKRYVSSEKLFEELEIKSDRQFSTEHGIAKNDLRMQVKGKHVLDVFKWFASKEDREISQWREFCEELLSTGILNKELFRYIDYKYVDTLLTPFQKARYLDCQELLIYEIFDLIPNEEQMHELEKLIDQGNNEKVKWADDMLINGLGFNEWSRETEFEIGAHTKWAANLKYSNE
ncbi:hypothetical protein [Pinibacter soli]|uniref:CD-NTase-associated protein 16 NUDIX domain-containing protein n=1 Tax=Pinibacter soli TaxID=3044211 RepID=A0ABT6RFS5_9BACT|nr:hypothetical protein [Pinibacter soli]MDI3321417.1 hypothetical protein [Pinibacter soli]